MIDVQFIIALPIGGIIGWIIREIVSDRLARERGFEAIKITEFNKSATQFRAAFVSEQYRLRNETPAIVTYLAAINERTPSTMIANEQAKILFEPFVSDTDGFNSAWEFYSTGWRDWLQECSDNNDKGIEEFLGHYFHLLDYAKPKLN